MEPTNSKWVMVLDLPLAIPAMARISADFQVISKNPIRQRFRYNASSALSYNTGPISTEQKKRGLQLPDDITPRMLELVQKWRSASSNDHDVIKQALEHFHTEEFYYTLRPPLLGKNPVDQFMFESRRGFCEHFATSFTLLMRLAGIPSRVVTGYQGGEINPIGGHLVVRQSDAHAWSEVWLKQRGWVRIDPTAAVAPERIERNFEFDSGLASGPFGRPINFNGLKLGFMGRMIKQLRWGVDAINTSWNRWILGYTRERQSMLMDRLGLDFLKGHNLAFAMVGFAAIFVIILGLYLWKSSNKIADKVHADYLRFCRKLAKKGLSRDPTEGPSDFLVRVCRSRPDIAPIASQITALYIGLRYGQSIKNERSRSLNRMVNSFRP
jgi:transglutaminase-like putative cysteine protease